MGLVEMGFVMVGRKLSPRVSHCGGQLSRSGSSMLTPHWILYPGGEQLQAVRAVNTQAAPSQCSCLPAMGAVLFTEHWLQELQVLEQRLPVAPAITDPAVCVSFSLFLSEIGRWRMPVDTHAQKCTQHCWRQVCACYWILCQCVISVLSEGSVTEFGLTLQFCKDETLSLPGSCRYPQSKL